MQNTEDDVNFADPLDVKKTKFFQLRPLTPGGSASGPRSPWAPPVHSKIFGGLAPVGRRLVHPRSHTLRHLSPRFLRFRASARRACRRPPPHYTGAPSLSVRWLYSP